MRSPTFVSSPSSAKRISVIAIAFFVIAVAGSAYLWSAKSQSRPRTTSQTNAGVSGPDERVKVDVDLVTIDALDRVPPHDEEAQHCLNKAFSDAADYIQRAGNPIGRRVIVAITGVTRDFDCQGGPSSKTASQAVYESGAVVSAIVPKTGEQQMENGVMRWATRIGSLG